MENRIFEELGSIKAKLENVSSDVAEIKADVKKHEARWNRVIGYCIAISAGAGAAVSFIPKAFASVFGFMK